MTASRLPEKARPTNADIMAALRELHDCVHAGSQETKALAKTVREDRHRTGNVIQGMQAQAARDVRETGERQARMEGILDTIQRSLGVKPTDDNTPPRPVKRFGSQKPLTVICQVFGAATGALAVMKFLAPPAQAVAAALWVQLTH